MNCVIKVDCQRRPAPINFADMLPLVAELVNRQMGNQKRSPWTWLNSIGAKLKWPQKGNIKVSARERGVLVFFRKRTRSTFYRICLVALASYSKFVFFRFSVFQPASQPASQPANRPAYLSGCLFLFRLTVNTKVLFLCWPHTVKCINHWTLRNFHSDFPSYSFFFLERKRLKI